MWRYNINVLVIENADGIVRSLSDCHVNVFFRSDRRTNIPFQADNMLNLHEFSREISSVQVTRHTAEEVASWILINQTAEVRPETQRRATVSRRFHLLR